MTEPQDVFEKLETFKKSLHCLFNRYWKLSTYVAVEETIYRLLVGEGKKQAIPLSNHEQKSPRFKC